MTPLPEATAQKRRGAWYTDPRLTSWLLRWVRGARPRVLLEPSCGDGAFFAPLRSAVPLPTLERVLAWELDPGEAARAGDLLRALPGVVAEVHAGDFVGWALERAGSPPEVDAVVGNPPFVRYQYLDHGDQERSAALLGRLGLRTTRHTNAWVPFLAGALDRLRPGGRLGMVVPAELLHVLHADAARRHLLTTCARVVVVDPRDLWFDSALQGVVLLLAEKRATPGIARLAVVAVDGRAAFEGDPEALVDHAALLDGRELPGKWVRAVLSPAERAALDTALAAPAVRPFGALARVRVGIVTGANDFFLVSDEVVDRHGLHAHARPMFGRSEDAAGVVYDAEDHAANRRRGSGTSFLHFDAEPHGEGARAWLAAGEARGLHRRYKCRVREPWYRVPSVSTAPVAMLKRCHDHPRLVLNRLGALTTDTAYRVDPHAIDPARLVGLFVNSFTALAAELEGRHYGGGVLELVPSEIRRLPIPLAPGVPRLEALDALVRARVGPEALFSEQDRAVLVPAGLGAEVAALRSGWWRLRDRRQRVKARSEGGPPGDEPA